MILFTADWHIKLGQKNVPVAWACARYNMFFEQIEEVIAENNCDLHIIGGDLFDRVPSMDELTLYFDFIKKVNVRTIIYDGNHEATRKNKTFFSNLKKVTSSINPLVFKTVFAGDLHAHENTQRNIVYPGSPMTTSFHRNQVQTGYLLIEGTDWKWGRFDLPQLIRTNTSNPEDMVQTEFHHTIYELEGDVQDLAKVKNTELLDKKVVRREMEATLNLHQDMTISEELIMYLQEILSLDESKVPNIIGVFNDYSKEAEVG